MLSLVGKMWGLMWERRLRPLLPFWIIRIKYKKSGTKLQQTAISECVDPILRSSKIFLQLFSRLIGKWRINFTVAFVSRYFGLSSTGMTYKSSAASYGSSSFHQGDHYGGLSGTRDGGFKEGYRARERYGDENEWNHENKVGFGNDGHEKSESQRGIGSESEQNNSKNTSTHYGG